jgi:hypothetical protein
VKVVTRVGAQTNKKKKKKKKKKSEKKKRSRNLQKLDDRQGTIESFSRGIL